MNITNTYFRLDSYGNVYQVIETKIDLSVSARDLYNYALDKGDQRFLLASEDARNNAAIDLVRAGLFTDLGNEYGYHTYGVQYAERHS